MISKHGRLSQLQFRNRRLGHMLRARTSCGISAKRAYGSGTGSAVRNRRHLCFHKTEAELSVFSAEQDGLREAR